MKDVDSKRSVRKHRGGWWVIVCGTLMLLAACGQNTPADGGRADLPPVLLEQLEVVEQNLSSHALPLRVVEVNPGGVLESDAEVDELRESLANDQALVPQYDGVHAESFSLSTVRERTSSFQRDSRNHQDVVANLQSMVFPLIEVGQRTVDLAWESEGRRFHTTAVYDEKGIVYDNVLSNLFLVEDDSSGETEESLLSNDTSGLQTQATRSLTKQVVSLRVKFFWGDTNGRIKIWHNVLYSDSSRNIYDQTIWSSAKMKIGTAKAEQKETAMDPQRFARSAYGYGWATPTASVNISFDGSGFKVSIGGIGGGEGFNGSHTFYYE